MWVLTSSPSQIYEVSGQGRLLSPGEEDYEGQMYMQCDIGCNLGLVDYICNNMPTTAYHCSNFVHPKPAALTFPKTGYAVASAEDCLDAYDYFSKYRKSENPVAVKQAIEAAQEFQARCKITEEQKAAVEQTIGSTQKHLERIKSNSTQYQSSGNDLLTGSEASEKIDANNLEQQFADLFNNTIIDSSSYYQLRASVVKGKLRIEVVGNTDEYYRSATSDEINAVNKSHDFSSLELRLRACGWDSLDCLDFYSTSSQKRLIYVLVRSEDWKLKGRLLLTLLEQIVLAQEGLKKEIDIDPPKVEPTTIEDYQKKVVAEAKTKGIILPANFLTEPPAPKKTTPARLTPRQRATQDTVNNQKIAELIAQTETEAKEENESLKIIELGAPLPTNDTLQKSESGIQLRNFALFDTNGTQRSFNELRGKNGTVIIFLSIYCPSVRSYNGRINQLVKEYESQGIKFIGINSNANEDNESIKNHANENYKFPILKDKDNILADLLEATTTPDVYFFDSKNILIYQGSIDNDRSGNKVSNSYLEVAINQILSNKPVEKSKTKAFGSAIKRVN